MGTVVGRGVKLEFALTYSAAKTVTAVTLASPGVATSTAHGMANGTVGYWDVTGGMPQLHGQATRVYNQATNAFDLQGLATTTYTAFTAGTFIPVATWGTLTEAIGYQIGGGAAPDLDDTKLVDVNEQFLPGLLPADSVSIDLLNQEVNTSLMQLIEDNAIALAYMVGRITLAGGAVRVFRGIPSRPGESLTRGQLATGSLQFKTRGFVLRGAA